MQSVEVPLQDVPPEVASVASQFIQPKSSAALASLACKLADAVFEDVPESSSGKVVAPKAKVHSITAFRSSMSLKGPLWFVRRGPLVWPAGMLAE